MNPHSASLAADRTRGSFSLWGWIMLLVIMLSAAPTGGAPRTQLFGSAFDPATYSVTTAPKRHSLVSELQTEDADEPDETPSLDYPVLADVVAAPMLSAIGPPPAGSPSASHYGNVPHLLADNLAARAPPST